MAELRLLVIFSLITDFALVTAQLKTTSTSTESNYFFEGVDYDNDMLLEQNDCYGQHVKCIRARTQFNPVCVYDKDTDYFEDFPNLCEVELQNCKAYAEDIYLYLPPNTPPRYIYNGEDLNCMFYYWRARDSEEMDRLYFGVENPPFKSKSTPEKYMRGKLPLGNRKLWNRRMTQYYNDWKPLRSLKVNTHLSTRNRIDTASVMLK